MTVAEFCVFGTLMLYLLTIVSVKWTAPRRYDNSKPRDPAFYDDPIRARALGAHQNGIEAFPFFAFAVLLAEFRQAPQHLVRRVYHEPICAYLQRLCLCSLCDVRPHCNQPHLSL